MTKDPTEEFEEFKLPRFQEDTTHVVIVNNEIHSSSCVLYYLECSRNSPGEAAKLELFFHLVQVKLITAMKHVVPLGYVVGCDIRKGKIHKPCGHQISSKRPRKTGCRLSENGSKLLKNWTKSKYDLK